MTINLSQVKLTLENANLLRSQGKIEEAKVAYKRGIEDLLFLIKHQEVPSVKAYLENTAVQYMDLYEKLQKGDLNVIPVPTSQNNIEKSKNEENNFILEEETNVHWNDIIGLQKAKEALKESIILPRKFPHLFTGNLKPWSGILLYGPPGTGKTQLAKAVASESKSSFFSLSASDIVSKWLGESEKVIKNLFTSAREKAPSVIFLDEIDSLCSSRTSNENDSIKRVKTELMLQTQGIKSTDNVLLLGATNLPWDIDAAMRRRFEKRIYIPLPNDENRLDLIKHFIGDTENDLDDEGFEVLVGLSKGFSGADISIAVREGLMVPLRKLIRTEYFLEENEIFSPASETTDGAIKINFYDIPAEKLAKVVRKKEDFILAFSTIKPSVSNESLFAFERWTSEFGEIGV